MMEKKRELIEREIEDMTYQELSHAVDQMEFGVSDAASSLSGKLSHINYSDGEHFMPPTSEEIDEVICEIWEEIHEVQ